MKSEPDLDRSIDDSVGPKSRKAEKSAASKEVLMKPGSLPPIKRGGHQSNQSQIQKKGLPPLEKQNNDYYAMGNKKKRNPSLEKQKAAPLPSKQAPQTARNLKPARSLQNLEKKEGAYKADKMHKRANEIEK